MSTKSTQKGRRKDQSLDKVAGLLFTAILATYLLTGAFRVDSGDGEVMYQVTRSIVEGRGFAIPPPDPEGTVWGQGDVLVTIEEAGRSMHGHFGADGQFYTVAGIGWSLAGIPFYILGKATASLIPDVAEGYVTRGAMAAMNSVMMSLTATVILLLAARLYPIRVALFISLAYALGTIAWAYARGTFSEPLVALGLVWAVFAAMRAEEDLRPIWWISAGVGLGAALLARQAAAMMTIPLGFWALYSGWRRTRLRGAFAHAVAFGLPVIGAQAAVLGYNVVRWGDLFDSGYKLSVGGSERLLGGLYGLILSPGKGLPLFVPLVLLGLAGWPLLLRRRPVLGTVLLTMILLQLGLYASSGRAWAGGLSWGPRHLVPVLAFFLLPIGEVWPVIRQKPWLEVLAGLLLASSVVVQLLGISVNIARHQQMVYARTRDLGEFFRRVHLTWPQSPIPGQLQSLLEIGSVMRERQEQDRLQELVETAWEKDLRDEEAQAIALLSLNVPDYWFVYGRYLGIGVGWRLGTAALLATLAGWSGIRLRRLLSDQPIRSSSGPRPSRHPDQSPPEC